MEEFPTVNLKKQREKRLVDLEEPSDKEKKEEALQKERTSEFKLFAPLN